MIGLVVELVVQYSSPKTDRNGLKQEIQIISRKLQRGTGKGIVRKQLTTEEKLTTKQILENVVDIE